MEQVKKKRPERFHPWGLTPWTHVALATLDKTISLKAQSEIRAKFGVSGDEFVVGA